MHGHARAHARTLAHAHIAHNHACVCTNVQATMQLCVLGLRGLRLPRRLDRATSLMTPQRPFVAFECGSEVRRVSRRTLPSNTPSPINPSYCKMLDIDVELPAERIFTPTVDVKVHDKLFGGFYEPVLGVGTITLADSLPFDKEGRLPSGWLGKSGDAPHEPPAKVSVEEVWENERWSGERWSKCLFGSDPPCWSNREAPYQELKKPNPSSGWQVGTPRAPGLVRLPCSRSRLCLWWHPRPHPLGRRARPRPHCPRALVSRVQVDRQLDGCDADEGWVYGLSFCDGSPDTFSRRDAMLDAVRRRRHFRTHHHGHERETLARSEMASRRERGLTISRLDDGDDGDAAGLGPTTASSGLFNATLAKSRKLRDGDGDGDNDGDGAGERTTPAGERTTPGESIGAVSQRPARRLTWRSSARGGSAHGAEMSSSLLARTGQQFSADLGGDAEMYPGVDAPHGDVEAPPPSPRADRASVTVRLPPSLHADHGASIKLEVDLATEKVGCLMARLEEEVDVPAADQKLSYEYASQAATGGKKKVRQVHLSDNAKTLGSYGVLNGGELTMEESRLEGLCRQLEALEEEQKKLRDRAKKAPLMLRAAAKAEAMVADRRHKQVGKAGHLCMSHLPRCSPSYRATLLPHLPRLPSSHHRALPYHRHTPVVELPPYARLARPNGPTDS